MSDLIAVTDGQSLTQATMLLLKKYKQQKKDMSKQSDELDSLVLEVASQRAKIDAALQALASLSSGKESSMAAGAVISQPASSAASTRKAVARFDTLHQGRGVAANRANLTASLIDSNTVHSLVQKFSTTVPAYYTFPATVPVVDRATDRVYFVANNNPAVAESNALYCLDYHTGAIIFKKLPVEITGVSGDTIRASPAIIGDHLFIGSSAGGKGCTIAKLNKLTGEVVFRKKLNTASPNAYLGTNFFPIDFTAIPKYKNLAVDHPRVVLVGEATNQSFAPADDPLQNVQGKCTDKGTMYCVNADTGALVWKFVVSPDDFKAGDRIGLDAFNKTVTKDAQGNITGYGYEQKMLIRVKLAAGMEVIDPDLATPKTKNQYRIAGSFKLVRPVFTAAGALAADNLQERKTQDFTGITTISAKGSGNDLEGYYGYAYLRPGDELSESEAYYSNFYGPSTWGGGPAFDVERDQVLCTTGQSHSVPMNHTTFLNWYNADGTSKDPVDYVNMDPANYATQRKSPLRAAYEALVSAKNTQASSPSVANQAALDAAQAAYNAARDLLKTRFDLISERGKRHYNNSCFALDVFTGNFKWSNKVSIWDVWNYAEINAWGQGILGPTGNYSNVRQEIIGINWGDDGDLSATPMIVASPDGDRAKDVCVCASKAGYVWSVKLADGSRDKFVLMGPPGLLGGNNYTLCSDNRYVYTVQVNSPVTPVGAAWITPKGTIVPYYTSFIACYDPFHAANDVNQGIKWEYVMPAGLTIGSCPTISRDLLVVPPSDGILRFLKKDDGSLVKAIKFPFASTAGLTASDDSLFMQGGFSSHAFFTPLTSGVTASCGSLICLQLEQNA